MRKWIDNSRSRRQFIAKASKAGLVSSALAGGGLKTGQAMGVTDELGKKILEQPISVPDLHATIHCALGIDPEKFLYDADRPVPITDRGQPLRQIFS